MSPPISAPPILAIVIPCYNEQDCLNNSIDILNSLIVKWKKEHLVSENSFCCYVDDGSQDSTWNIISAASIENTSVRGIKFGGNAGHQNALIAGLEKVHPFCDCAVTIDADLQDDPEVIKEMIIQYLNGSKVVFGIREERKSDSLFKRTTALGFYNLMKLARVNIIHNHADYRLMDKDAINFLLQFPERNLFLRGIVASFKFKHSFVYYNRAPRTAGESKYPLLKMLAFAWEGITSFSVFPLRMLSIIGLFLFFVSMGIMTWILITWVGGKTVPGWTSIIGSLLLFQAFHFISLGIIGEYIGKLYKETKQRPRYFVQENVGFDNRSQE